ncbi:MAG: hypothetical protein CME88_12400 [Hirschia sp.]|nr:hypothetical protein [Hirschia sp.]MBF19169.1 hypothetical protein [Hirschia sp.]|tara:strand:- start:222 stop:497 length:276 start_codon:yes stop_codon:yes gene_type:complete
MDDESHSVGSSGAIDNATRERLRQTIEKIERLEIEKKEIAEQIKDVYAEAKAHGFDTKAIRAVVKLRKEDREKREEHELILGTYLAALGEI